MSIDKLFVPVRLCWSSFQARWRRLKKYTLVELASRTREIKLKEGGTYMELSEMTIQYQGFHPSDFTKDYLESMMDEFYSESPYNSFFQAVVSRQNHMFKVRVRIDSSNGHFFAVASGKQLRDVGHRVTHQIRKQLSRWKTLRFHNRSPRVDGENYHVGRESIFQEMQHNREVFETRRSLEKRHPRNSPKI
jgi:hypothetical protein